MFRGKPFLTLALGLGGLYAGLVIWAKFSPVIGAPPVRLGELGEFLLFFAAVLAFSIQVLIEGRLAPDGEGGA